MFGLVLVFTSAQDLPECVSDAFPDLNITDVISYGKQKGVACDLCVNLLTEIGEILEDQTIEDAVS